MKDINTLNAPFQGDWRAVLDFLGGILVKYNVEKISITRSSDRWKVDVDGLKHKKKRNNALGGLYDLYW